MGYVIVGTADDTIGSVANLLDVFEFLFDAESRTSTNEFFRARLGRSQGSFDLAPHLLLECLHLFLEGRVVAGCLLAGRLLLLLLLLPGCLLLLLALAVGAILVSRSLAAALGRLLLLLLLLHVLAIRALFTGPALSRSMLRSSS